MDGSRPSAYSLWLEKWKKLIQCLRKTKSQWSSTRSLQEDCWSGNIVFSEQIITLISFPHLLQTIAGPKQIKNSESNRPSIRVRRKTSLDELTYTTCRTRIQHTVLAAKKDKRLLRLTNNIRQRALRVEYVRARIVYRTKHRTHRI